MILSAFTVFHVILSLVAIGAGLVVLYGMLTSMRLDGWNTLFLTTTVATSVTGFLFPFHGFTPGHAVGIISLLVLALAYFALYGRRLGGGWGRTYVITSIIALYLNVFVLVVQLFEKAPPLRALGPTQSEPPFQVTQLAVLVLFVALGILAALRYRKESFRTA